MVSIKELLQKQLLFKDNIVILYSQSNAKSNNKFQSKVNPVRASNPVSNYKTTPKWDGWWVMVNLTR